MEFLTPLPSKAPDYANYNIDAEEARRKQHEEDLKVHLEEMGYNGKHKWKIARFGVADGFAEYMLADGNGRYGRSFLIHLPYMDGYHFQYVDKLSKKDIVENIERDERVANLFNNRRATTDEDPPKATDVKATGIITTLPLSHRYSIDTLAVNALSAYNTLYYEGILG